MPITEIDIYRAAKLLIDRHGKHAALEAAGRADKMLACRDIDGERVWLRIRDAVVELQRTERVSDEVLQ